MKSRKIETIIAGGLATDYCVFETVLELNDAGFNVVVNLKACRGIAGKTTTAAIESVTEKRLS